MKILWHPPSVAIVYVAIISILLAKNAQGAQVSARAIEARLFAPCCYSQTLDVHESEIAQSLREEIARRVSLGETAESIDADFVARYGPQIRAIQPWATLLIPSLALAGTLAGLLVIGMMMRRWRAPLSGMPISVATERDPMKAPGHDDLDARLDDDLSALDG